MNPSSNPLAHPHEDLLTAFAERSLTPVERLKVQSHLADCERCRQVIFLANAAKEELQPAYAAKARTSFPRTRVAWALAGTLACVLLLFLPLVMRRPRPQFTGVKTGPAAAESQQVAVLTKPLTRTDRDGGQASQPDLHDTQAAASKIN